jgi:hypothetical protein
VTAWLPVLPTVKVMLFALVIVGASFTVRVKFCVPPPLAVKVML